MSRSTAEIVREYGPFPGADRVHGVTYDGRNVWFAAGDRLNAFDPASGKTLRSIDVAAHAGTAFDGEHLFQLAEDRIQKIDPKTGRVLATIPAPGGGGDSGLTWAEGTLWVGQYRDRKIYQIDPRTGAILRTIESNRFVTGVTWVDGELWHATWEGDESDLRRVDPRTGEVLERLEMPPGVEVSGLESDGGDLFFCGGARSGKVRAVRRPRRGAATGSGSETAGSTRKSSKRPRGRASIKDGLTRPLRERFLSRPDPEESRMGMTGEPGRMPRRSSGRPLAGEFAEYARPDIDLVRGDDAVEILIAQERSTLALLAPLDEDRIKGLTYAPGKWTLKQVVGHLADDERIFAYRALCIARADDRPLPGFDENVYVEAAGFERRTLEDLLGEYRSVRQASITLFSGLTPEAWIRKGSVNGYDASARGLAFHIAGHELRHVRSLKEKYLPKIP